MMLNNSLGCCTIAAVGHADQTWSANAGFEGTMDDSVILSYYEKWDGYEGTPDTDNGGIELDVLKQWQKSDFNGVKLTAFVAAGVLDLNVVRQAINLFGGVYIGVALPISAQRQKVWDTDVSTDGIPGSWGGHAVFVNAYDQDSFTCVTWGALKKMTTRFWAECVDEAYALLSPDWFRNNVAPSGFDLAQLQSDLALIR